MCYINFVREFQAIMDECKNEYLSPRERMLWIAIFQCANNKARYNQESDTYDWPMDFFQVSNDDLNAYCGIGKNAIEQLRESLKERGYIDFIPGCKNSKQKPMYRLHYLTASESIPQTIPNEQEAPEQEPKTCAKPDAKAGAKECAKNGAKTVAKVGAYTNKPKSIGVKERTDDDTRRYNYEGNPRARSSGYLDLQGENQPARYDCAWLTSEQARKAVAQRILDGYTGSYIPGTNIHSVICDHLARGMPPELIEDIALQCKDTSDLRAELWLIAYKRGFTEEAQELERCRRIAKGNEAFAQSLYRISMRSKQVYDA